MSEEIASITPQKPPLSVGKKILITALILLGIGLIIGVLSRNSISSAQSALNAVQNPTSTQSAPVQNSDPMTDKSFHLQSVSFNSNDAGFVEANARITNISDSAKGGVFSITIFEADGVTVADNLLGGSGPVQPGQTVTVAFVAKGQPPVGKFNYAFQVTIEN